MRADARLVLAAGAAVLCWWWWSGRGAPERVMVVPVGFREHVATIRGGYAYLADSPLDGRTSHIRTVHIPDGASRMVAVVPLNGWTPHGITVLGDRLALVVGPYSQTPVAQGFAGADAGKALPTAMAMGGGSGASTARGRGRQPAPLDVPSATLFTYSLAAGATGAVAVPIRGGPGQAAITASAVYWIRPLASPDSGRAAGAVRHANETNSGSGSFDRWRGTFDLMSAPLSDKPATVALGGLRGIPSIAPCGGGIACRLGDPGSRAPTDLYYLPSPGTAAWRIRDYSSVDPPVVQRGRLYWLEDAPAEPAHEGAQASPGTRLVSAGPGGGERRIERTWTQGEREITGLSHLAAHNGHLFVLLSEVPKQRGRGNLPGVRPDPGQTSLCMVDPGVRGGLRRLSVVHGQGYYDGPYYYFADTERHEDLFGSLSGAPLQTTVTILFRCRLPR